MEGKAGWRQLLEDWQLWMSVTGHSPRTIGQRGEVVALLARRMGCDPVHCDWRTIAQFLDWRAPKPDGWQLGDPIPAKAGAGTRH